VIATPEDFLNRWHSALDQPLPHWVEVHLAKPAKISRVVVHFADPAGYPVSFQGSVRLSGQEHPVLDVTNNHETQVYRTRIAPVMADSFRLTVRASANPAYPNAAQISEIELYR
jgi:hypothetical protein